MSKTSALTPEFVDHVPATLDEGVLYVSMRYATAAHRCCCGCGHEVVTPLSPTDLTLNFDGVGVTLNPSIGNWSFECQSHYWIRRNRVRWAPRWSRREIERGRRHDRDAKARHYGDGMRHDSTSPDATPDRKTKDKGVGAWLRRWP